MATTTNQDDGHGNLSCDSEGVGMRDSPFQALPPELRNHIWELSFEGLWDVAAIRPLREISHPERQPSGQNHLALLLTCKAVHQEAAGFAWQNVSAIIDIEPASADPNFSRTKDITPEIIHADDTCASACFEAMLSQIGHRLIEVTELDCRSGVCIGICHDYWTRRKDRLQRTLAYATALLIPKLTALHRIRIYNPDTFIQFKDMLVLSHVQHWGGNVFQRWRLATFKEQLAEFKSLFLGVTELEVECDVWDESLARSVPMQLTVEISGTCFTHSDTGTAWEVAAEMASIEELSYEV